MSRRARSSGIALTQRDAAIAKGMLLRGDRQHDVAAWFGVNGGRIAELASGYRFWWVKAVPQDLLPPPGPYPCGREAQAALDALTHAKKALAEAEKLIRLHCAA